MELSQLEIMRRADPALFNKFINDCTELEAADLYFDPELILRPKQLKVIHSVAETILVLAGRDFGKTMSGGYWVNHKAKQNPGCRIALVGESTDDVRGTMITGHSGILNTAHPSNMPHYIESKKIDALTWPNGSMASIAYGDEQPLRGPQFHFAWIDELAKIRDQEEVWDMLVMCVRLGLDPQILATTTPRPTPLINQLVEDPHTELITGSSFENYALSPKVMDKWKRMYEGTRKGLQELYAEILNDNPNALWEANDIDSNRIRPDRGPAIEEYDSIVVSVDPATTANPNSDETGIVVTGRIDDRGYLLEDYTHDGPCKVEEWAKRVVRMYDKWSADIVVGEINNGGDLIESVIRNVRSGIPYKKVTATRGKHLRAEPIVGLYQQGRIHHIGNYAKLEQQMLGFDPDLGNKQKSPDRMDALVWGFTALFNEDIDGPTIWSPDD